MRRTDRLYYSIAGLELCIDKDLMMVKVDGQEPQFRIGSFAPFLRTAPTKSTPDCIVILSNDKKQASETAWPEAEDMQLRHTFEFSDADAICRFYKSIDTPTTCYLLGIENEGELIVEFKFNTLTNEVICRPTPNCRIGVNDRNFSSFLRFGLWFSLGIAAAQHKVAAIHSSALVYNDSAVMFLGESGTGKSTHTRLWRENIEGATLLNDDSPFIGFIDGKPMVYGSPWSGKTPCYKDLRYPLRAFVRLSQAPHNKIRRLNGVEAIGAVLPSLPPAFAYDATLKEMMFDILGEVLAKTEVYHLECLPNAEAALITKDALFKV